MSTPRRILAFIGVVVLLVSLCLLGWALWPPPQRTVVVPLESDNLRLPTEALPADSAPPVKAVPGGDGAW
jgi:hypothetical protein